MNQIKGNVYILDSAELYLTGNSSSTGTFHDMSVSAVAFYGTSTTSELALSFASANSLDFLHMKTTSPTGGTDLIHFAEPFKISERVYARLVTAGTGYIYFA